MQLGPQLSTEPNRTGMGGAECAETTMIVVMSHVLARVSRTEQNHRLVAVVGQWVRVLYSVHPPALSNCQQCYLEKWASARLPRMSILVLH